MMALALYIIAYIVTYINNGEIAIPVNTQISVNVNMSDTGCGFNRLNGIPVTCLRVSSEFLAGII